jgi:hypothetical protein
MTKLLTIAAVSIALIAPAAAYADTYTYACKVKDEATSNVHLYSAKLDLGKHTITWRGHVYKNVKPVFTSGDGKDCGKECFGNSKDVSLDIATQGVATLSVIYPGDDQVEQFDCDQVHP